MCIAAAAVPYVISAVGAVASGVAAYQSADATNRAVEEQAQVQADEAADARDMDIMERIKAGRAERSRMRVASGEAGVRGASVDALIKDSFGRSNQDIAVIHKQGKNTARSIRARTKANAAGYNSWDTISSGVQIAGAAYGAHKASKPAKIPTTN